jgi:hypothetical protein
MSTSYYVYPNLDRVGTMHVFKRSTRAIRDGQMLGGVLVTDLNTAASALAQRRASQRWGRTAEALTTPGGYTSDGARIFRAEIWTRRRTRCVGELFFAIKRHVD